MSKRKPSKSSKFRSIRIDRLLQQENEHRKREVQLLLIGPPQSGKNTVCKQLRIHFGDGYPTTNRIKLIPTILANLADAVTLVIENMNNLCIEFADGSARELSTGLLDARPIGGYLADLLRKSNHADKNQPEHGNGRISPQGGTDERFFRHVVSPIEDTKQMFETLSNADSTTISDQGNRENMQPHFFLDPYDEYSCDGANLQDAIVRALRDQDSIPPSLVKRLELIADANMMEQLQDARTNPVKFRSLLFDYLGSGTDKNFDSPIKDFRPPSPSSPPPKTFEEELLDCLVDDNETGSNDSMSTSGSTTTATVKIATSQLESDTPVVISNVKQAASNGLDPNEEVLSNSRTGELNESTQDVRELMKSYTDRESGPIPKNKVDSLLHPFPAGVGFFDLRQSSVQLTSSLQSLKVILKLITEQNEFQETIASRTLISPSITYADSYFISHVDRIIQEDYIPTLQDILVMRQPSKAIRETVTSIGFTSVRTIDLAEQGRYPNRHLHYFESVNTVLFLVSLVECVDSKNCVIISSKLNGYLDLFQSLITSPHMTKKDFIVFLNKLDLIKCVNHQANTIEPDRTDSDHSHEIDKLVEQIRQAFLTVRHQQNAKIGRLNFQVTCALDVDQMKDTITDCVRGMFDISRKRHTFL